MIRNQKRRGSKGANKKFRRTLSESERLQIEKDKEERLKRIEDKLNSDDNQPWVERGNKYLESVLNTQQMTVEEACRDWGEMYLSEDDWDLYSEYVACDVLGEMRGILPSNTINRLRQRFPYRFKRAVLYRAVHSEFEEAKDHRAETELSTDEFMDLERELPVEPKEINSEEIEKRLPYSFYDGV